MVIPLKRVFTYFNNLRRSCIIFFVKCCAEESKYMHSLSPSPTKLNRFIMVKTAGLLMILRQTRHKTPQSQSQNKTESGLSLESFIVFFHPRVDRVLPF